MTIFFFGNIISIFELRSIFTFSFLLGSPLSLSLSPLSLTHFLFNLLPNPHPLPSSVHRPTKTASSSNSLSRASLRREVFTVVRHSTTKTSLSTSPTVTPPTPSPSYIFNLCYSPVGRTESQPLGRCSDAHARIHSSRTTCTPRPH